MKIHKLLIGCSILMTLSLLTGCSNKSDTNIDDLIETTIVSDEELNKNAYEVTETLPDNSITRNEALDGNTAPNTSEQLDSDITGKVTAIDNNTLTISIEDDTDSNISEQTLNVTSETFINIQTKNETTAASFTDIKVGDMIKYRFTLSETGEQILYDITIMNTDSNKTTHTK